MHNRKTYFFLAITALLIIAFVAYYYFLFNGPGNIQPPDSSASPSPNYTPFGRVPSPTPTTGAPEPTDTAGPTPSNTVPPAGKIPSLRLLSGSPVGGYGTFANGSTTVVRWVDRGRGNVYEASQNKPGVSTLSNTIVPRIYESVWNANASAFVSLMLQKTDMDASGVFAYLQKNTATSSDQTPFELKGRDLPANIITYAVSPKRDKLFMLVNENGGQTGYVSNFDGSRPAKIFTTPLTQVNAEWPEANTIAITTRGSISQPGFLYFVNPKTGIWKKILGPIAGLSTKVSRDAKYVLASSAGRNSDVQTGIYDVAKAAFSDSTMRTLADKCAWGNYYKNLVFCAVPSQALAGLYPDDWYKGTISTVDKIWQLNALNGNVNILSSVVDESDRVIDAFNLATDAKDNYLIFMNKNDLSLWSLNLQ